MLSNRFGQTSESDFILNLEPIKMRRINVCLMWKSSPSPLPLSPRFCLLPLTVATRHVAAILSLLDLPHHATVVLSEASCSFGSENSVTMSVLAGRGGHVIPRQCHREETSPAAAMPSSACFLGGMKVVPEVRRGAEGPSTWLRISPKITASQQGFCLGVAFWSIV